MNTHRWASLQEMAQDMLRRAEWLPLREAAALYRVTPDTMRVWVQREIFPSTTFGNEVWVARNELEAALRRPPRTAYPPPPARRRRVNQPRTRAARHACAAHAARANPRPT
ncbi:MAG TPA: hypothetical protein VFT99_18035 [Roseiflexaceae bacterium]|nr:hypothetical protein [Roseiflexaceae bacterium]